MNSSNNNQPVRSGGGMSPQMITLLAGLLYTISPLDFLPDFLPLIGQADDVGVICLALIIMLAFTLAQAGQKGGE